MGNYYITQTSCNGMKNVIYYKNSKNDINGTIRLLETIKLNFGGNIEKDFDNNIFYIKNNEFDLKFIWVVNKGLTVEFIDKYSKVNPEYIKDMFRQCFDILNCLDAEIILKDINNYLKDFAWYDFSFLKYDEFDLHIAGSVDLSYGYQIEIIFKGATFICCSSSWSTSPNEDTVFSLADLDDIKFINENYPIDMGYAIIIKIKPEDYKNKFFIACYDISYSKNC